MSAETIKELVVHLGIEADEKPLELFEDAWEKLKHGLLGGAASIAAAGEGLFQLVEHTAEAGKQAILMSQRIGVGVERVQELAFASKMGLDEFGLSMVFLNRSLNELATGQGNAYKAFHQFGIGAMEVKNGSLKADQALMRIADRFATMPDGPKKTALAVELFGRSGARMIPMLNKGSAGIRELSEEAQELGVVMTEAQAKMGIQFTNSMHTLEATITGIFRTVGLNLLPAVTDTVKAFQQFLFQNRAIIKENLTGFAKGLATYLRRAVSVLLLVGQALSGVVRGFGGAEKATSLFLTAIGVLSAGSILFGIGRLVQGVYALVVAFEAADVAALAIPILIGAAIAAVLLIFEDLAAYFRGENSVFGILEEKFNGMGNAAKIAFTAILTPIRLVSNAFGLIIDLIDTITGKLSAMELFQRTAGRLFNTFGFGNTSATFQGATGIGDPLANVFGAPRIVPANGGGQGGGPQNNIQTAITVTVPPGTDPAAVPGAVERGVSGGLDGVLRQANRATTGGIAH